MGFAFIREYENAPTFRGFKRVHVTSYGDHYGAEDNAITFLADNDTVDFKGYVITLSGFEYDGGHGIYVAADGFHLGTIWPTAARNSDYFDAIYNGAISGVFLRIEREDSRPWVRLFVDLRQ